MKKALFWLVVLVMIYFTFTRILFPITAGVIGYFDKDQDEVLDPKERRG